MSRERRREMVDREHPAQPGVGDGHHLHPHGRGFHYLVAIMDWYTRYVVAWNLSNTLVANFCVEASEEALRKGKPVVFNTDQGPSHRR